MSLREVLIDELRDLYSAENQQIKQLPKTARASENAQLKQLFLTHLDETRQQVERLKQVFEMLGKKPTGKHCKGMEGAIDEVKEAIEEDEEGALYDAGIVGGAVRVEHYEVAGYSVAIAMAKQLGETEIAGLLSQTLTEEQNTAKLIMTAAKGILKEAAAEEKDDKNVEDEEPKDAEEQKSKAESEQDEADAKEGMGKSAADAMKSSKADKKSAKTAAKKTTKKAGKKK